MNDPIESLLEHIDRLAGDLEQLRGEVAALRRPVPQTEPAPSERRTTFRTAGTLSVADSFLFANELFGGNRPELEGVLEEIDRLSSEEQLEHYLYDTLRLEPDREEVKRFRDFIRAHTTLG